MTSINFPRRIALLGSTGSIGQQTLDVIRCFPDHFRVVALAARQNVELLASQAREFNVPVTACFAESPEIAQAARAASRSLDGEFSRRIHALVDELIQLRVFIEGALDFSDEDIDWLADEKLRLRLATLIEHLRTLIAQAARGRS